MADAQFIGLFFGLLFIMIITEMGLLTVCDRLKTIVRLLEKLEKRIEEERREDDGST